MQAALCRIVRSQIEIECVCCDASTLLSSYFNAVLTLWSAFTYFVFYMDFSENTTKTGKGCETCRHPRENILRRKLGCDPSLRKVKYDENLLVLGNTHISGISTVLLPYSLLFYGTSRHFPTLTASGFRNWEWELG